MASSGNKQVVDLFTALSFNTKINFLLAVLYLSKGWNGEVIRTLEVLLFCPWRTLCTAQPLLSVGSRNVGITF